jgi:MFS family permease
VPSKAAQASIRPELALAVLPLTRAATTVLLPFAAGYFLSCLFRTINAVSSARLGAELRLDATALGLLTAAYFLAFAAAQLPVGIALDRFGPRRVQLALLPVAALGAALFAAADGFVLLLLGRALVGLGVAAALMAGLKALVLWFPHERLALANGCYVMLGALGAVTATVPTEALLQSLGWRGLFVALAGLTVGAAGLLWMVAPRDAVTPAPSGMPPPALRQVFRDRNFWRVAPLSACCIGTAFALQGLWAGPWLADVALLDRPAVVRGLLAMGLGLCAGALLLGIAADRLRRRGVRPGDLLVVVAGGAMLAQLGLVLRLPIPLEVLLAFLGAVGSATVLSYAALAENFPKELAGRANAALNLLHIGAAFLVQAGIGCVVGLWAAAPEGRYPAAAYDAAFGANLVPQAIALVWFLLAPRTLSARRRMH